MFEINITCNKGEMVCFEKQNGNITNEQTSYVIDLLKRHNYLPTDKQVKEINVVAGNEDIIDIFPYDEDGEALVDLSSVITVKHLTTLN